MEKPLFIAKFRFDPLDGEEWQKYCDWAKIPNLKEIVSLDIMLGPRIINGFLPEDWGHNVQEDFRLDYFYDVDYLVKRTAQASRRNILGVFRNPETQIDKPPMSNFDFVGHDLIEDMTGISALTNCGGFPDSFANCELNHFGLLTDFDRAVEVRNDLKIRNPKEPHANCELYSVWRLRSI